MGKKQRHERTTKEAVISGGKNSPRGDFAVVDGLEGLGVVVI